MVGLGIYISNAKDANIILAIVISTAVIIISSLTIGFKVMNKISELIQDFSEGSNALANGNLDYEFPAYGNKDRRSFASSFNVMARKMRSNLKDLESERSKLSAVLETMNDGVIVADSEAKITLMNPSAQLLLGFTEDGYRKLTNASDYDSLGHIWDHELRTMILNTVNNAESHNQDILLQPNKNVVNAITTPINHLGTEGVLVTLRNITEYRNVENTRREFVSNVSHELRSPLASIKALIETLMDGAIKDKSVSADYLSRINTDVDRMNQLVGELLELSTLESGLVHMDIQNVNINDSIFNVVRSLDHKANGKNIDIAYPNPSIDLEVLADKRKMIQVIINLLDNAIRFTPENGKILISTSQIGDMVEISIEDNGIGISTEDQKHVFERFYKVDPSRTGSGTGLGLAIAKHIVMAHSGNISLDSKPGEGSKLSFKLRKT